MKVTRPWLWLWLAFLPACLRDGERRRGDEDAHPPAGSGRVTDEQGVRRTLFQPLGMLTYGQTVTAPLGELNDFFGYEFKAPAGSQARITLALTQDSEAMVALYGPRDLTGLWDDTLLWTKGDDELNLTAEPFSQDGYYFILLRTLEHPGRPFSLTLECESGCETPTCAEVDACDLYCERGYVFDDLGCRTCSCIEETCTPTCQDDEQCIDGECIAEDPCEALCGGVVDPTCGRDGKTYANPCLARCAEVEIDHDGACDTSECDDARPCTGGRTCKEGRCVAPDCACSDEVSPVCGKDGSTYRNRCFAACAETAVDYQGECVARRCEDASTCPEDWRCDPAPQIPENRARCPDRPDCVRQCQPPVARACNDDSPCQSPSICYQDDGEPFGFCAAPCTLTSPRCTNETTCADVGLAGDQGLCLPTCGPTGGCPRPLLCGRDERDLPVCRACGCSDQPTRPVCGEGRDFRNECEARCAGVDRTTDGPCDTQSCDFCPMEPEWICADGQIYLSTCEALCDDATLSDPTQCYPDGYRVSCHDDQDCQVTGGGTVCATEAVNASPDLSPEAACAARFGRCECAGDRCGFWPTRDVARCIDELRGDGPPD